MLRLDLHGRTVLLIDDILDTGHTLRFLADHLVRRGAEKVRLCVLLKRAVNEGKTAIAADFAGFSIGNEFVVGYGLDHAGRFRHLPDLAALVQLVNFGASFALSRDGPPNNGCERMAVFMARSEEFYAGVQKTLRTELGKALSPGFFEALALHAEFGFRRDRVEAGDGAIFDSVRLDGREPRRRRARRIDVQRKLLLDTSRFSGDAPGIAAAWLDLFAEGEYGALEKGICAEEPQCGKCALKEKCRYLATGGKDERASGDSFWPRNSRLRTDGIAARESRAVGFAGVPARRDKMRRGRLRARGSRVENVRRIARKVRSESAKTLRAHRLRCRVAHALFELRSPAFVRVLGGQEQTARGKVFSKGQDFFDHFHLRLRDYKKEVFYVTLHDQRNALIAEERVSEGSLTETLVHPREVFSHGGRQARGVRWRVVHNHPSGDPTPSTNDKAITKRLDSAAQLLGIRLLDHVIVGDGKYTSFVEKGLLR